MDAIRINITNQTKSLAVSGYSWKTTFTINDWKQTIFKKLLLFASKKRDRLLKKFCLLWASSNVRHSLIAKKPHHFHRSPSHSSLQRDIQNDSNDSLKSQFEVLILIVPFKFHHGKIIECVQILSLMSQGVPYYFEILG